MILSTLFASSCTRVLCIVDGNIKGEKKLGKCENVVRFRERERELNNWLMEMGW
ncbi:MAG: hypothetical protein K6F93_01075 [Lachnospiraceae bacterium]|nr:hypothetical protein [Lachnospiraceae bacterium]